jgi:hypothetical protein
MTITASPIQSHPSRARSTHNERSLPRRGRRASHGSATPLGRYSDPAGRPREVVALAGCAGSVLVVDRDVSTLGDRLLVAHLGAEEPRANASLVCRHYLQDPAARWCRSVSARDLEIEPFPEPPAPACEETVDVNGRELVDADGWVHRLEAQGSGTAIPVLRWRRRPPHTGGGEPRVESVREAVGSLESYEPLRTLTVAMLARHRDDPAVSVTALRAELQRLDASRIVLNRGLRLAVLEAVRTGGLSLSEIALRCGRVKHDARGRASGETTWLARRVGIAPGAGERIPTPWVHSEVLALIARSGLGVSPREVELG